MINCIHARDQHTIFHIIAPNNSSFGVQVALTIAIDMVDREYKSIGSMDVDTERAWMHLQRLLYSLSTLAIAFKLDLNAETWVINRLEIPKINA